MISYKSLEPSGLYTHTKGGAEELNHACPLFSFLPPEITVKALTCYTRPDSSCPLFNTVYNLKHVHLEGRGVISVQPAHNREALISLG